MLAEGQRVDQFYTHQPRPASQSVLQSLKIAFDYLECNGGCGTMLETPLLTEREIKGWKFGIMGLRPSILNTAHGTCPVCQELQKQFKRILG